MELRLQIIFSGNLIIFTNFDKENWQNDRLQANEAKILRKINYDGGNC